MRPGRRTDAHISTTQRGKLLFFPEKKKRFEKKIREEKGQKGERKKERKKVLHKNVSQKSTHHGEFIRRVARANLEQYA